MTEVPSTESAEIEPVTDAVADEDVTPPMNRAERRAAARGGPAQKIAGPATGRAPAPPVRHRDYASRKRG
jgi:hypothetical protein